ncbi:MAG: sulfotransferase [Salinisphaera sp.]|nr:sulfotransferase [Salinisphaera sp.]
MTPDTVPALTNNHDYHLSAEGNSNVIKPIFLIGAPRSGTTWLQLLLAQSPHVVTCNETHLFSSYLGSAFQSWKHFQSNNRAIGLHHIVSEADYMACLKHQCDSLFERIKESKPSASLFLEKTPAHARCWERITQLYPEARFIHLIRDPRAVVASLRRAAQTWGSSWARPGIAHNSHLWLSDVTNARKIAQTSTPYIEVTYESIRADTSAEIRNIFSFMGIEHSIDECFSYERACAMDRLKEADPRTAVPWNLGSEPPGFFRKGEAEGWKKVLSNRDISLIESITFSIAERLNYERTAVRRTFYPHYVLHDMLTRSEKYLAWKIQSVRTKL